MKEDYVSFEIAKLLKENGFDWKCLDWYSTKGNLYYYADSFEKDLDGIDELCSAPTLQVSMKWLREVKNIIITMDYDEYELSNNKKAAGYSYAIQKQSNPSEFFKIGHAVYDTYEAACEAAIKDCVTNLI